MASPPSRRDDQTGSSVAFIQAVARATGAKVDIDGADALIGDTRIPIELTGRDEVRRLLGLRPSRKRPITVDECGTSRSRRRALQRE
jgi:hypothetical protein